jgi:hypothetical protein
MKQQQRSIFWWPMWVTMVVLLVFFFANLLSDQVTWSMFDFLIGGGLIFAFATVEIFLWKKLHSQYRWFVLLFALFLFLILWAEMAVGLFGSPLAGN